ncbi:DegV family protein [Paenibacillus sp. F411]|uniref:DegV family protein n=1 Tax=Paenibacillus sp. F411 TaxID=2820239 RepID=UPI003263AC1C
MPMRSLAWVTDSTSTLDPSFMEQNHIYMVPLRLILGNQEFREQVDISAEQFYEKMLNEPKVGSSQPPIGEFIELYESLKERYDDIIAVHCSAGLSGTLNTSIQAAEIAEADVIAIDSKFGAFPVREMIQSGVQWHQDGCSAEEIAERIRKMREMTKFYLIPFSLQRLHAGGRMSGTKLVFSQLLKIHLLLRFDDGKVIVDEKIRTYKKARQRMLDYLSNDIASTSKICIMHAGNLEEALSVQRELSELYPEVPSEIMTFIPVAGIYAGEGTIALSWILKS